LLAFEGGEQYRLMWLPVVDFDLLLCTHHANPRRDVAKP